MTLVGLITREAAEAEKKAIAGPKGPKVRLPLGLLSSISPVAPPLLFQLRKLTSNSICVLSVQKRVIDDTKSDSRASTPGSAGGPSKKSKKTAA
jgi:hypothetical protein